MKGGRRLLITEEAHIAVIYNSTRLVTIHSSDQLSRMQKKKKHKLDKGTRGKVNWARKESEVNF